MKKSIDYPRVLIVYNSRINTFDQHGVSIRGWFADWPKENLAQIYSGIENEEASFSSSNFQLGIKERRFGKYFFKLKKSSFGQSSYSVSLDDKSKNINKYNFLSLLKTKISGWLVNTGLWELIFSPKLSKEMIKFVEDFNPQIIYCQGYSLTFAWLPVMIHNKTRTPICFQTGDDWPSHLYKNSIISILVRPIVNKAVKTLISKSVLRLANGKLMSDVFNERYGVSFGINMMCDNIKRFQNANIYQVVDKSSISIVYSGNLGSGRWMSIIDLCEAVEMLDNEGLNISVVAFASTIPPEGVNELLKYSNLQILPNPSHDDLPSYLKGADILFLPETFDSNQAESVRLSISSKAHLYMLSEKPILVYGSSINGIVSYAEEGGWACIVKEKSRIKLSQSILQLINDSVYRNILIEKGKIVAQRNHDSILIRSNFEELMQSVISSNAKSL